MTLQFDLEKEQSKFGGIILLINLFISEINRVSSMEVVIKMGRYLTGSQCKSMRMGGVLENLVFLVDSYCKDDLNTLELWKVEKLFNLQ